MSDYGDRFGGVARLYGVEGLECFRSARALVIGLGGVGSWTVEALARSGLGALTLMDLDDICVTNVNRQLPALSGAIGKSKGAELAARGALIAPECAFRVIHAFLGPGNAGEVLCAGAADVVIDATDNAGTKALIIDTCVRSGLPVITAGGAGGRRDITRIQSGTLAATAGDPLLKLVRKTLRREFGWPEGESFGCRAVFSSEPLWFPAADGCVSHAREGDSSLRMDCASGFGAACHLTGAFGFALAGAALETILEGKVNPPTPAATSVGSL